MNVNESVLLKLSQWLGIVKKISVKVFITNGIKKIKLTIMGKQTKLVTYETYSC